MNELNTYSNLQSISARTPEKLQEIIRSIPHQVEVITIYFANGAHIAWIRTHAILKKVKKGEMTNG